MSEKNYKRCCFAGHGSISDTAKTVEKIKQVAEDLILNYGVKEFWVGHYGSFDGCSASAIRELKKDYPEITLELVIPYLTKSIIEYKVLYDGKFDNILVADVPENTPRKFHLVKGNEYMVDNSDYLICYINHSWGGAYRTYTYARRKKKKMFNVADNPVNE